MKEDETRESHLPAIASGALIDIAEQAERRVAAIIKIKKVALMVTNRYDWTNMQDKPYLMTSGSEKIANLFNISWRIDEPRFEVEEDGHFTYTFKGEFSLADRTVEVEGSRSSKDPFFKKYDWIEGEDGKKTKKEKPISAIDKRDVKMAALTNLLGNGISRILGIRNLQWSDLEEFASIKKGDVQGIEYKTKGEIKEPQKKSSEPDQPGGHPDNSISDPQRKRFYAIAKNTKATDDQIKEWLFKEYKIEHSKNIPKNLYDEICEKVKRILVEKPPEDDNAQF